MNPKPFIQPIQHFSKNGQFVDLLRLDTIHPIVSGNKWYKLQFYIAAAKQSKAKKIASFGGPYSNHIVALAYVAKSNNLESIGYIRSNEGEPLTPTLEDALAYGMQLIFLGRTNFKEEKEKLLVENKAGIYFIDEGGYGALGARGAEKILSDNPTSHYDYIIAAVGTGTMFTGLLNAALPNQQMIGIPILKEAGSIEAAIHHLCTRPNAAFTLLSNFHQGGYAKTSPAQIDFMNLLWEIEKIPTDIVYTGKLLFAVAQLMKEAYFEKGVKILTIHSGGLQGNRSLKKGILHF